MIRTMRAFLLTLALLPLCTLPSPCHGKEFRLGIISAKPAEKKIEGYGPLATYVARGLGRFGITGGKVVVATNLKEMMAKIRSGEVDVVFESGSSTMKLKNKMGMIPRLLVWKDGHREYRGVFFVRKKSRIKSLSDLKGKTVVFQDPESTSAFLLPRAELREKGLSVLPVSGEKDHRGVRYRFVEHAKNQVFWVIQKRADAGAFSSDDWRELSDNIRSELKIIHQTRPVVRYLASFNPALPANLADAIADALVHITDSNEGRKILEGASDTSRIEPLRQADMTSLDYIRKIMSISGH